MLELDPPDEADGFGALARMVLGLTWSAGGMVAFAGIATNSPAAVLAIPAAAMMLLLVRGATPPAAWCGIAIWLLLLPMAHADGIVVQLAMIVICAAIAVGPERLFAWLTDVPSPTDRERTDLEPAWIEEL